MRRMWAMLMLTLFVALITPAPNGSRKSETAGTQLFSVVADDFVSPLISSPQAVQTLNVRLGSKAIFAGYDQLEGFVRYGGKAKLTTIARYCGDIFSALNAEFVLRSNPGRLDHPAYVSERYWRNALFETPDLLGQAIQVCGVEYQIAGVVRIGPGVLSDTEVWAPICSRGPFGTMSSMRVIGKLIRGTNWRTGEKELARLLKTPVVRDQIMEFDSIRLLPLDRRVLFYAQADDAREAFGSEWALVQRTNSTPGITRNWPGAISGVGQKRAG